jgi:hypothetical protein
MPETRRTAGFQCDTEKSINKDYLVNIDYARHLWMEKEIKSVANVTSHGPFSG